MTDTAIVTPLPLKADFLDLVMKERNNTEKQEMTLATQRVPVRRAQAVEAASVARTTFVSPRHTSWSLVTLAYGFFGLGVSINIWNAWSAGNIADTALPAAMGVLAEGVVFFLPARLVALPAAHRALGIGLLVFVSAFALTNSLRMASIVAADTTAARADRQTDGTRAVDAALDAARKARDDACARGQGKTVACKTRVDEVGKLESERSRAIGRVVAEARPEAADFAGLVAWVSAGAVQPGTKDFDMLWLLFRTFLPQVGGIVLMLARR